LTSVPGRRVPIVTTSSTTGA